MKMVLNLIGKLLAIALKLVLLLLIENDFEQLKPNYDQIKSDVVLTIIPFGKSFSVVNSTGTLRARS